MFVANLVLFWAVFKRWKWLMAPWLLLYPIGVLTNIGIGIYYFVKGKKLHTWLPVLIACKLHMYVRSKGSRVRKALLFQFLSTHISFLLLEHFFNGLETRWIL